MNKLNVFTFGYYSARPRNWGHNFVQFFRNIQYAIERAIKGYCEYDLWDCYSFYLNIFASSLKDFAEKTDGYPTIGYENFKEWKNAILHAAADFSFLLSDPDEENPYSDAYYKILETKPIDDYNENWSPEEEKIKQLYFNKDIELNKKRQKIQNATFDWLRANISSLWN